MCENKDIIIIIRSLEKCRFNFKDHVYVPQTNMCKVQ